MHYRNCSVGGGGGGGGGGMQLISAIKGVLYIIKTEDVFLFTIHAAVHFDLSL